MAELSNCEKQVIEKLILVFSKTLNCQAKSEVNSDEGVASLNEVPMLEKILKILLTYNDTFFLDANTEQSSDNGQANVDYQGLILNIENSTDALRYSEPPSLSGHDAGGSTSASINNINSHEQSKFRLEIIKVFVLIFVISIILLTTCRMVFQLFIKFRPEKPPLG